MAGDSVWNGFDNWSWDLNISQSAKKDCVCAGDEGIWGENPFDISKQLPLGG